MGRIYVVSWPGADASRPTVRVFVDRASAELFSDGLPDADSAVVVGEASDFARSNTSGPIMVRLFNAWAAEGGVTLKKFEDLASARDRTFRRLDDTFRHQEVLEVPLKETAAIAEPAAPDEPKEATVTKARARTKKGNGHFADDAKITLLVDENPKRKTGAAFKRFELYRNGMLVSTFLEKGGLRADLSWDVSHKFIRVS